MWNADGSTRSRTASMAPGRDDAGMAPKLRDRVVDPIACTLQVRHGRTRAGHGFMNSRLLDRLRGHVPVLTAMNGFAAFHLGLPRPAVQHAGFHADLTAVRT